MRMKYTRILVLLSAVGLAGCPDFTTATGVFATSTSATVQALGPLMSLHDEQCHRDASWNWLFKNTAEAMAAGPNAPWPGVVSLSRPTVPILDRASGQLSEIPAGDYCQRLGVADAVVGEALEILDGYASALSALATGKGIDTDALDTTVKDATAMAGLISGDTSESKAVSDVVAQLLSPMDAVVKQVVAGVKNARLKEAIRDSDPHVKTVVATLQKYVAANRTLALKANLMMSEAMRSSEARLKGQPLSPLQALQFADRMAAEKAQAARTMAALDQFDALLVALSHAEEKLFSAATGTGDVKEKEALEQALGYAKEILTHVATLKALVEERS